MDKLEELTLFFLGRPKVKEGRPESTKFIAANVLRGLKESKIRKVCGEVIYRAGVQEYTLGKVSEEKFADNTLLGRVGGKKSSHGDIEYFQPGITLETNAGTIRTYGECQCTLALEGTICPHMAAVMIAWAREPRKFTEDLGYLRTRFEKLKQNVMSSLEDLLGSVETSSRAEVFALLQKTFSQLRSWGNGVKEVKRHEDLEPYSRFHPLREFSGTINYVSLAIIAAIERKYAVQAIDIYNRASLTTFGRVLDLFVESTRYSGKSPDSPAKNEEKKLVFHNAVGGQKTARSGTC